MNLEEEDKGHKPIFLEAMRFWFVLGWISFGGTTGHVTLMHDFLVEKKKWVSNKKFFQALNACMLLPGPEAHQLTIYLGWKLHGLKGGVLAGLFFIVPSLLIIFGLSTIYAHYGTSALLMALFSGLKPAVLGIIIFATFRVGQKSLVSGWHYGVALAAFFLSYFVGVPMPWIIVGVIASGILLYPILSKSSKIDTGLENEGAQLESSYYINTLEKLPSLSYRRTFAQILLFVLLWLIPFSTLLFFTVDTDFWKTLSFLFTKSAYLTIGGSYTVIPYVAALVTEKLLWLTKIQMIDGFALAETTPGPLVVVLAYVGFMAGFNHFQQSYAMAAIGLAATAYFTFLPNFALIFVGAPLIERAQKNARIQYILSLVTASVVGVIVNLACYLGQGILFPQGIDAWFSIDPFAVVWLLFSVFLLFKYRIGMLKLILLSLIYGFVLFLWR
ncbi:chromate efflux transporter [Sphingobacterium sp.]|uniref:chromate efflux transporter n=1 Tax=Sphingobacterium sp. TaxID=341027 RepID=UPI0028A14F0A|nr:chromate efflux transporter [Sphingobacterium sp.]